ncbi:MAG: heat-shock protein HtpX [Planctomycetota bacterium]|nr:MAG: heat-shock protein HtpX [Planctomycetota bacterium]
MDFFEHQDAARKRTAQLIVLFALAVVGTLIATYLLLLGALYLGGFSQSLQAGDGAHTQPTFALWNPLVMAIAVGATGLIVGGGTLYKINELSGGGEVIASHLGGRRVARGTSDLAERRLLNVVEEMAIASGTPVPPVFVLDEELGINAFAAGKEPGDAVIGVTRGCMELLSRDELQGVIAHEFSHILNGDMKLNIRLIGILHGILVLSLIGQFIMRSVWYAPRSRSEKGNAALFILVFGMGLVVIGAIGSFFGNWIKAGVSRQREYLADAAAVQFTRNPGGIAGALKKILGLSAGSKVNSPAAPEASHMFFGRATTSGFAGIFATHPPLPKRIRRIDPQWDGKVEKVEPVSRRGAGRASDESGRQAEGFAVVTGLAGAAASATTALGSVGTLDRDHVEHARHMIDRLAEPLQRACDDPFGAQAVIFALLIDADPVIAEAQFDLIARHGPKGLDRATRGLVDPIRNAGRRAHLAIVDLALPALRELSAGQYEAFRSLVEALIAADRKISLFEWCLQRLVLGLLDEQFGRTKSMRTEYYALGRLQPQLCTLLSALSRVGQSDEPSRQRAFRAGASRLGDVALGEMNAGSLSDLDRAVAELARVAPKHKRRVIEACAATLAADGEAKVDETELFRAVAQALGVPVPPILPGTPLV